MAITHFGNKMLRGTKVDRVVDSLGSSGDGTNSGITFNAVKDYAVFDGSNDYITFATKFNQMQQAGSFSVWIKPANIGSTGNDIIFDNSDVSSANNGFSIRHSDPSGSKTVVLFGIWGSTDGSITTDAIWTGDEWQHLVVTYDGTTGKVYRNGTLVKSGALTANSSAGSYNARIGWGANGNDHKFEGGMYQALIYNDALTQSEVTTLYNSGTPVASPSTSGLVTKLNLSSDTNDSQGSNNGTNTGVTFSTDNSKFGGSYSFNGSSSVVEVSGQTTFTEINNPNQISTIVFWYKSSSSPSSTYDKIMGTVDQSASDRGFNIMRYQGSGKGMISLTQAGGNKGLNDFTTTTGLFPVDGNWYHYAFKFDDVAGKLSIYKDGSLFEEEDYASWTPATGGDTQRPFQIGKDTSNSKWFNGQIDDCAIYYRGLTATEIEKLVNNNSPSPNITNSPAYTQVGSTVVASGTTIEATNCQSNQNPVHRVYKDIGSVSDSTFYFEFDYKQKQNTNNLFPIALQSGTGKTNIASEDMIYLKTDGLNMTIAKKNGGSNTNSSDGWITIVANTQYYCSITRESNTASLKVYTDSGRSSNQVGGTKTVSVSDVSGLQYIHSESRGDGGGGTNIGWVLDNISLTNGATTKATEGDPQLVSSLSNKTGLKAHYSMDSVGGTEYGSLVLNDVMHWEASQNSYTEPHPVIFGNKITSGNPLIGKTINHVGFQLYRGQGTTTDTITFAVWDGTSTSTTPRYTFGSMDISDIVTSGSLGSSSPCQLYVIGSSDSGVTIQENDVIGAVHNRESGTYTTPNSVEMGQEDATATYSNGHRAINMRNTSSARSWHEATNKSPYFTTASYCENDSSDASPVANLVNGFIMESTSDGKHYMWNSTTSTWTEVA